MNSYLKIFLTRGAIFGGFGPIICAIVYFSIDLSLPDFSLSGGEVLLGVVSTYILTFLHAGASVFNQIEHWSIAKSLFFHFLTLYLAYTGCYVINTWIPFEPMALVIFTLVFVLAYFAIWLTVYISVRKTIKRFNSRLKN